MTGRRALTVLGAGLLGSQAGHLLAYQVRFGAAAPQLQSSGPHAYFPTTVRAAIGVAAALVLAAVFGIGLVRMLGGRPVQPGSAPSYVRLVAMLYTIQLASYAAQEAGEALAAGMSVDSAAHLLLWGTLGQLPVAIVAAAGVRWLLARFEGAVAEIRIALASIPKQVSPVAVAISVWGHLDHDLGFRNESRSSPAKRGPPFSLRFSSN